MLNISPLHIPVPNTNLPTTPTSNFVHSDISESNETVPSLVNEVLHQVDTLKTDPSSNKMLPDLPNLTAIKTNDTITHSFDRLTEKNLLLNNNFNDYFSLKTHQQSKQSIESPASTEILSARDKTPQQFHQSEFQDSPDTPDLQLETSHPHFAKIPPHQTHSTGHQNQAHTNHSHNHHFSHHAETISEFPQTLRRHTSPHAIYQHKHGILSNIRNSLDGPSLTTLMSKVNRTLVPRSTFPSHFKSEFTRDHARNSIGSKRRKKRWLDDDNVIMGNKISEGHENFVMAYNMLTGIRVAVSRCSGVMNKITDEDFKTTKKLLFNMDGSELTPSSKYDFKFKDYCPEVFRDLRTLFGLDPADYLVSITGKYILSELGSPGKSGSFFYYSRDYRFIIKTIHHSEHKQLRRILKDYYGHVKENPNTLISQFYGLHRLKMPFKNGSKKVHFVVMNNLFPPHRDIHLKYDLKGSTWGRITRIDKNTDLSQVTLKDINWLERQDKINLGPSKRKLFFQQLDADVKLLKKINVMDYSLLLGVHDVKRGNTDELKLSVFDPKSSNKSELIKTNPRDIDREIDLPNQVFPGRTRFIFYGHDGGIRATNGNNEPLYQIYYLGIIDCLTNYGCKKRLETAWRSFSHPRETISAVPANEYGDRFLKFIKDGTTKFKEKRQ